jgi:DNA/RNA-binding domain of Phe-tRNA-synthetase-like protein
MKDKIEKINLYISSEVRVKFPDLQEVMMPVYGVKVAKNEAVLTEKDFKDLLGEKTEEEFFDQEDFRLFREFAKDLKIDLVKNPPSVEFLFKRYQKTGKVPNINRVVDAANKVALQTLVATGTFDMDKIEGDMQLRLTREGEKFDPLGGDTEFLPAGLVVIADEKKILNLFPFRDSVHQKITEETQNVLILADKMPGQDLEKVRDAVRQVSDLLVEHCGGEKGEMYMAEDQPIHLKFGKKKIPDYKKMRVLSGITPSGNTLHLGNYAGAVKPQFDLLEKGVESYYFVADLHALTTIQDKERLEKCIINNVFDYIALGLDPEKGFTFVNRMFLSTQCCYRSC